MSDLPDTKPLDEIIVGRVEPRQRRPLGGRMMSEILV